jgi:hypothetical protein
LERVREFWAGLTDRERKLLTVFGSVLVIVGMFLLINTLRVNLNTYSTGIERGHEALDLISQRQKAYLKARAQSEAFDQKLENNTVQIAAFTEQMARRAGIGSPRNFRDQETPVPNASGVIKQSSTVTFPEVSIVELNELLGSIEDSDELIYVEGIELEPQRRGSKYEVQLTIATYRLAPEGA